MATRRRSREHDGRGERRYIFGWRFVLGAATACAALLLLRRRRRRSGSRAIFDAYGEAWHERSRANGEHNSHLFI
jgi:hypothetical protein